MRISVRFGTERDWWRKIPNTNFHEWNESPRNFSPRVLQRIQIRDRPIHPWSSVLNLSPSAVRDLELGNDFIRFNARFGGTPMDVIVPPAAVLGLYSREQGHGMLFPEEKPDNSPKPPDDPEPMPPKDRPTLKVVK